MRIARDRKRQFRRGCASLFQSKCQCRAEARRKNCKGSARMSATIHALERSRAFRAPPRPPRAQPVRNAESCSWLVDVGALAVARGLFAGHEPLATAPVVEQQALLDVPPAYDQFCRSHFASVRRLHPELDWHDACPAYAVALSLHASLCDALDEAREKPLAEHWPRIRGGSRLEWRQAAPLVADGCSALARLDPLAMRR
jgi:hypothetical protein